MRHPAITADDAGLAVVLFFFRIPDNFLTDNFKPVYPAASEHLIHAHGLLEVVVLPSPVTLDKDGAKSSS
jgi:hypothetical protein